jgi:hypothetical protein
MRERRERLNWQQAAGANAWCHLPPASLGHYATLSFVVRGWSQRTDDRSFKIPNIEQQNKEPQNDDVITSIFCGSERR